MRDQVGRRLKELREELGIRPEQVALALDMSASNYNHYETGRHRLRLDQLPVIAETLGVTREELLIRLLSLDTRRLLEATRGLG